METQTMEAVAVIVPCPSCARPMGVIGDSWQCLACHPIPVDIPICATQKCKKPLTKLGDPWNCWICLKCNKHPAEVNKMKKEDDEKKRIYLDKKVTQKDVAQMVADGIAEAMAKFQTDYPPTQAAITQIAEGEGIIVNPYENVVVEVKPETYLQKAKRLGVATHIPTGGMRKKVEIMADIEGVEKADAAVSSIVDGAVDAALGVKEEKEAEKMRRAAQSPPSDNDEFARGLTAEDMV